MSLNKLNSSILLNKIDMRLNVKYEKLKPTLKMENRGD